MFSFMHLNILEKNKEFQMELLSHNVIFNVYIYIYNLKVWNQFNEWKYPKAFWKHYN